jgi:hypothetical protein
MTPGKMVILAPVHVAEIQKLDEQNRVVHTESYKAKNAESLKPEIQETVGLYQSASEFFTSGKLKVK